MSNSQPADPYLLWAEKTGFRDHEIGTNGTIAVAFECLDGKTVLETILAVAQDTNLGGSVEFLPFVQKKFLPADLHAIRFATARLPKGMLAIFAGHVKRLELSMAVVVPPPLAPPKAFSVEGVMPYKDAPVIAVIDDEFAVDHQVFRSKSGTRFQFVWSQQDETPKGPGRWEPFKDVPGLVFQLKGQASKFERKALKSKGQALKSGQEPRRRWTHGTAVAAIAAGAHVDRRSVPGHGLAPRADGLDRAAELPLIGVQLPKKSIADTSGGAMAGNVLDALHYILAVAGAKTPKDDAPRPVVVNLSYATSAGPHDGTTILEQAMAELIALRKGRLQIVIPAGNAYEARTHAAGEIDRFKVTELEWFVSPDDCTPSFLEAWVEQGKPFEIRVTSPAGQSSGWQSPSNTVWASADLSWGISFPPLPSTSTTQVCALVCLARTGGFVAGGPVFAKPGRWKVELRQPAGATDPLPYNAWIERDDNMYGHRSRGRQSWFIDRKYQKYASTYDEPQDTPDCPVKRAGSFNTIANGEGTVVVGGYEVRGGRMAPYSAEAAQSPLHSWPDVSAACETGRGLPGVRCAATFGVDTVRLGGTSFAVPQVVRGIANWMAGNMGRTSWDGVSVYEMLASPPARRAKPGKVSREGMFRI